MGGIVGSVIGAFTGSSGAGAANQAAGIQAASTAEGVAEQRRQFNLTRADVTRERALAKQQLEPIRRIGIGALEEQQALTGLGGEQAQQEAFQAFSDSPGQQFLRNQQERSLLRNSSAIGGLGGGNVRSALQQQAFGRAQTDFANQFNRLGVLSGAGQSAAQNIGQFGTGSAGQLGQFGAQTSGNVSNLLQAGGQARASGILGAQQARGQGAANIIGLGSSLFSDRRLKKNIKRIGTHAIGVGLYAFEYLWGEKAEGVMSDEVREIMPEAVTIDESGYDMVDYNMLEA